jgi:hypothetical protein
MPKTWFKHWSYLVTGPVLGGLLILFWFFNQKFLTVEGSPALGILENPVLTFGMIILGAFASAFIAGEFSIKTPVTYGPLGLAFIGGIMMGIGAGLASMSVHSIVLFNLAGIFNLCAFMVAKGWIYALCMIAGGYAGSKLFLLLIERSGYIKKDFYIPERFLSREFPKKLLIYALSFLTCLVFLVILFSRVSPGEKTGFVAGLFFLLIFGVVAERGTVCMSSMLKEWFIGSSAYVWRSVLFTVMWLAAFYTLGLGLNLFQPFQAERCVHELGLLAAGSFLMGAGFIFADGCFIGSLWKTAQGNVVNLFGLIGMLLAMGGMQPLIKSFAASPGQPRSCIPNYLSAVLPLPVLVIILWVAGMLLLVLNRLKHYRY